MTAEPDGRQALDELYWRSEILQALYWMRGEGLAEAVSPPDLARFLAADAEVVADHLERLAAEGFVEGAEDGHSERSEESVPGRPRILRCAQNDGQTPSIPNSHPPTPSSYRLTPLGLEEGGRDFHDEFADYLRPAHGECGRGCWCKDPKHAGEPCPNLEPEHARA